MLRCRSRHLGLGAAGSLAFTLAVSLATALTTTPASALGDSPFTKGPYVQNLGSTTAELRVEVDPPAPVSIDLGDGPSDAGAPGHLEHAEAAAFHVFPLAGLSPRTRYIVTASAGPSGQVRATKVASFTTAPPDDSKEPIRFLIYGDNRSDDTAHGAVVRTMVSRPSDFLLNTGDLVEHGGVPGLWQRFFEIEAPLLSTQCLFATIGNHELADKEATLYLRYFGDGSPKVTAGVAPPAPILHHTFRWGNIRVFTLAGMGDVGEERRWLEGALTSADNEPGLVHRIVMTHHGLWSSGPHGGNQKLHSANVVDLLRAHHVSIMLSGHDHIYERGEADGVPYLVSGGGGAPLYEQRDKLPSTRMFDSVRHFVEVRATPDMLKFRALRTDGSVLEECGLPANHSGWDCDKRTSAASGDDAGPKSSGPQTSGAVKSDASKSSCACRTAPGASGGAARLGVDAGATFLFGLFLLGSRRYARKRCASPRSSS